MAKKIENIVGLHNLYSVETKTIDGVDVLYYDISNMVNTYNQSVDKNTVLFVDADFEDVNKYIYINSTLKMIRPGDNYIIANGKLYSNNYSLEGQYIPSYVIGPKGDPGPQGEQGPQGSQGIAGTYTAGNNISITNNAISAKGYIYNETTNSFAAGTSALASGDYSHAEGVSTTASGNNSHAEGTQTTAQGVYSHTEGYNTKTIGQSSHAEGENTTASSIYSHAEGYNTNADGSSSHAEGAFSIAAGQYSHAEGYNTYASAESSHAEGNNTTASDNCSHAEGYSTTASGYCSHAEGYNTKAQGYYSHSEGISTIAEGNYSHAEGNNTHAKVGSHAEGYHTDADGSYSHAEGDRTYAKGSYSHTEGVYTTTTNTAEHAEGKYNVSNTGTRSSIGIGTSDTDRKNAVEVMDNGDVYIYGIGDYDGTNITTTNTEGEITPSSIQTVITNIENNMGNIIAVVGGDVVDEVDTNTYIKYVTQELTEEQQVQARLNISAFTSYEYYKNNGGTLAEVPYNVMIKYLFTPFMVSRNSVTTIPDDLLNESKTMFVTEYYWNIMRITGGEPIVTVQWNDNIPYKFKGILNNEVFVIDFTNKIIKPESL